MKNLAILFVLLALLHAPGCGLDCIDKKTGMGKVSQSLSDSKKKNVFKFEMQPGKHIFTLDSGQVFKIKNAWVEHHWSYECIDNKAVIHRDSFLQLVIDAEYNGEVYMSDYWLNITDTTHRGSTGNHLGASLDFAYNGQDTIYLELAKGTTPVDTIEFVKGE